MNFDHILLIPDIVFASFNVILKIMRFVWSLIMCWNFGFLKKKKKNIKTRLKNYLPLTVNIPRLFKVIGIPLQKKRAGTQPKIIFRGN